MALEQVRISAKNLGALALPDFCPRCFWVKLKCDNKLPYQIFPGIFSSIDSYSKKITNLHFNRVQKVPKWLSDFGELGQPVDVPHFSKYSVIHEQTNILLTGVPDEIFLLNENSYFIVDYKTAKFTERQDKLLPMYETQLNAYAYIGEKVGFEPIKGIGLVYYEPLSDINEQIIDNHILDNGFSMHFAGKLLPIDLNPTSIEPLLRTVREIYDQPKAPSGIMGCIDCQSLDQLLNLLSPDYEIR